MKTVAEVYSNVLDYLLPELCQLCNGPSSRGYCDGCCGDFRAVTDACSTCGLARPVSRCPLSESNWSIDRVVAPLQYEHPLTTQILALKFSARRSLGRALGLILARHLADAGPIKADVVIAVPLHHRRLVERGYNQALEIARPVASELGLPLWISGIRRKRATQPLAALDARARRVGVRGAFSVTRDIEGLNVAIVDDVITTGATANAFAAALRKAGAHHVEAWAVARAL